MHLMKKLDARLARALATAASTHLGRFAFSIAVLITVPFARGALDAESFGVWMMLDALLGFFAFADLRIGNGVLNATTVVR